MNPFYKKIIFFNLFSACFCMSGQLALNTTLSYLFSNSIYIFSFFIGLYLMSMGLGVLIVNKLPISEKNVINFIVANALISILIANPGFFTLLYFNEETRMLLRTTHSQLHNLVFLFGIILTILLGIVSGIELPLFSKLLESTQEKDSSILTALLTTDYLGAFVGSVLFSILFYPFWGLIKGIILSQLFLLIALGIITATSFKMINKYLIVVLLIISVYVSFSWFNVDLFLEYLVKLTT